MGEAPKIKHPISAQNIPGVPGEDYPIFVLPPETQFDCNEQIEGETPLKYKFEFLCFLCPQEYSRPPEQGPSRGVRVHQLDTQAY